MSDEPPDAGAPVGPLVIVDDERATPSTAGTTDRRPVDVAACRSLVADVLQHEGLGNRSLEVHVHVVDEGPMAVLNVEHMGGDGPTDVLSFPVDDPTEVPDGVPVLLGDIVLCPTVADRQAAAHAGDYETEVALLLVHGVLHLLGHDHADPAEEEAMRERERLHLARHGRVRP